MLCEISIVWLRNGEKIGGKQMYIFLTVCWWISFAMTVVFAIKNFRENEKYMLHEWIACAFSMIFLMLRRLMG